MNGGMLWRASIVWLAILACAVVNGALRDLVLTPRVGDLWGRALSSIILSALVVLATSSSLRWIAPPNLRSAAVVGVLWTSMTLAFEFLAGHFLFHKPWPELLADYDVTRGRIWIIVLVTTLIAPITVFLRAARR